MRRAGRLILCLFLLTLGLCRGGEESLTRLFDREYDFWDCDWSPDSRCLALAGKNHSQPAEKSRIWLFSANADKPIPWTNTDAYCDDWPRWSPNGRSLCLVRRELDGKRRTCLWSKDILTGAGRRLTKGPDDRQPSWSPDGRAIVFRRGLGPDTAVLAVFDPATGRVSILPLPPGLPGEPFWASDGSIYHTRYQSHRRETKAGDRTYTVEVISGRIWRFDPATGQGEPVLSGEFDQRMPALSPDGKWLAFYGQREVSSFIPTIPNPEHWALYLRDQTTGKVTEAVINVALTGGPPSWNRDSRTITFYSLRKVRPALWSYALAAAVEPGR